MKKLALWAAIISAIAVYAFPPVITQAGADPAVTGTTAPATIYMRITAYSSVPNQTDDTPFITASGLMVRDGIVATNLLPMGTLVQIPALFGKKVFVVEDRMSRKFQNTVDIWMPSTAKAIRFGLHYTDVVIVKQVPATAVSLTSALK